jgi:alpha-tubulin suppressor-like RCC1 family protein
LGTGQPTAFIAYSPARVGGDSDWATVSCGPSHVLALKKDGSLYAWGQANSGAIGDGGSGAMQTQPVRVGNDSDWKYIHAGYISSYAIKNDGRLFAWGLNSSGKLGDGTTETRLAPVEIGPGAAWRQVACSEYHCLGIQEDGSL